MKRVYKTKEQRNLKPGKTYRFYVLKTIELPEGNQFFVLIDPFGEKHLLPFLNYKHYPITIESEYYCHVDKINCQGRVFLEPIHPYYTVGKAYPFTPLKKTDLKFKKGSRPFFEMMGQNGEIAYLPLNEGIALSGIKSDYYRVVQIKKGKIFLKLPGN